MHKRTARRNPWVTAAATHRRLQALYWGAKARGVHTIRAAARYNSSGERAVIRGRTSMGKLTTHVLNVAAGIPAVGMRVDLRCLSDASVAPRGALTDADGRFGAPLLDGAAFAPGRYALTFQVAAYFRSLGMVLPEPPFLDEVVIAFGIADAGQNYHVPLLVSPWSYSTYRGS
jgi:5-hydroxyisourate hydrolase